MADRAAGVILMLQWKYPDQAIDYGTLYRADHVGGFKTGYVPGNSMVWNPIWSPVVGQFFWILDRMGFISLNPHEMPGPATTSSECTIMSLQALRLYKMLLPGRTPNKPGAAPKLNVRPADATYATGGGIWQASADKKGALMAKASGGPASWAESAAAIEHPLHSSCGISRKNFGCNDCYYSHSGESYGCQ